MDIQKPCISTLLDICGKILPLLHYFANFDFVVVWNLFDANNIFLPLKWLCLLILISSFCCNDIVFFTAKKIGDIYTFLKTSIEFVNEVKVVFCFSFAIHIIKSQLLQLYFYIIIWLIILVKNKKKEWQILYMFWFQSDFIRYKTTSWYLFYYMHTKFINRIKHKFKRKKEGVVY